MAFTAAGGEWGRVDGCEWHYQRGATRDSVLPSKILGCLNNHDDKAYGGSRVLRLSPSLVMHALRMQQCSKAKGGASNEGEERDRPKTDQTEKPQNQPRRSRRGWVQIRDIERLKIHTLPQPRLFAMSPWPIRRLIGPILFVDGAHTGNYSISMSHFHPLAGVHSIFWR